MPATRLSAPPPGDQLEMPSVLWLASYPKSGNTWLRSLLYHLLHGPLARSEDLQCAVPDAHKLRHLPASAVGRTALPVKTHWLPEQIPFAHRVVGFVYVARNPWDVALSNFDYRLLCGAGAALPDTAIEGACYVEQFIAHRGDPRWLRLGMGTWCGHIRAWRVTAERVPNLWLRYEDLLADPVHASGHLCRFLGLERDTASIARAVDGASFAAMRRLEEAEIRERRGGLFAQRGLEVGHEAGRRFINRGLATYGVGQMAPEQIERLGELFAGELELLGYPRRPGAAVAA
jgi:aryl sulfotransferase